MLNQISPMDTFSAAPSNPQATDLDKHQLKKCQKEIRRLSLANVHLDQQLDFFQGNLEEIRLRYQAEAQRDCYRAMTLALSKRLGLEDSVPQITLLPPEKED